ncbi:hypothetical protein [Halococcus thailandensis]|nr:hypothetical protein [Halococcus thailandensis]
MTDADCTAVREPLRMQTVQFPFLAHAGVTTRLTAVTDSNE